MSLELCNAAPLEWLWRQGCKAKLDSCKTCIGGREQFCFLLFHLLAMRLYIYTHTHIFLPDLFFWGITLRDFTQEPSLGHVVWTEHTQPSCQSACHRTQDWVQEWVFNQIWAPSTAPLPDLRNKNVFFLCKDSAALHCKQPSCYPKLVRYILKPRRNKLRCWGAP